MSDPIATAQQATNFIEKGGILALLLLIGLGLAFVLYKGVKLFLTRIDTSEANCRQDNALLRAEIVELRKRHDEEMGAHVIHRQQTAVECKVAIERMTAVAERSNDISDRMVRAVERFSASDRYERPPRG